MASWAKALEKTIDQYMLDRSRHALANTYKFAALADKTGRKQQLLRAAVRYSGTTLMGPAFIGAVESVWPTKYEN